MSKGPIKYSDFFDDDVRNGLNNLNKLFSDLSFSAGALRNIFVKELTASAKELKSLSSQLATMKKKLDDIDVSSDGAASAISGFGAEVEKLIAKNQRQKQINDGLIHSIDAQTLGLKECRAVIRSLEKEYTNLSADTAEHKQRQDELLKKIKEVSAQFNKLNGGLRNAKRSVDLVKGSYAYLSKQTNDLKKELQNLPGAFNHTTGAIDKTNKKAVDLQRQIKANTEALKKMDAQMGMYYRNVGNYSSAFSKIGGGILGFSAQVLGISTAADVIRKTLDANIEIEAQIADLRRIMGITKDETYELVEALKELSTPTSTVELVRIATIGSQLGVARKDIVGFTEAVDMLSVVLKNEIPGGAEVVAESLGKINGVFKVTETESVSTGEALQKTGSAILALGQAGLATGEFLQDFTLRVGGAAKAANLGLPTILAYGAVLEEAGISAEVAGTSFNRLVGSLTSRREQFYAIAKIADASLTLEQFTEIINTDTNKALTLFYQGLNKGGVSLTAFNDLLDKIKIKAGPGKNAIIALAREQEKLTQRINEGTEAFNEGTLAGEQFAGMTDNLSASWDKMIKAFADTSTKRSVAGFFKTIIDGITGTVNKLNELVSSSSWKEFFARFGSIFGPSVGPMSGSMWGDLAKADVEIEKRIAKRNAGIKKDPVGYQLQEFKDMSPQDQEKWLSAQEEAYKVHREDYDLKKKASEVTKRDLVNMRYQAELLIGMRKIWKERNKTARGDGGGDVNPDPEFDPKKAEEAAKKALEQAKRMIDESEKLNLLMLQNAYASQSEFNGKIIQNEADLQKEKLKIQQEAIDARLKLEKDGSPQYKQLEAERRSLEIAHSKWLETYNKKQLQSQYEIELANLEQIYASGKILEAEYQKQRTDILVAELDRRIKAETDAVKKAQLEAQKAQAIKEGAEKFVTVAGTPMLKTEADKEFSTKVAAARRSAERDQIKLDEREAGGEDVTTLRLSREAAMLQELKDLHRIYGKDILDLMLDVEANITASNIRATQKRIESIEKIQSVMMQSVDVISDYLGEGWGNLFGTLTDQMFDFVKKGKIEFKDLVQAVMFYGDIAKSVGQIMFDSQIEQSQKRIEVLEAEKARVVEIETKGIQDEEERAVAKARIEEEYNAKIREEKRKMALAERNHALFQIAMNTAMGVMMALAQLGPIAGLIMAGVVGTLGAAQAAMVMSKPLAYWTGTRSSDEGMADIAERGPELVTDRRTGKTTYYDKPTKIFISKGSQVFNTRDTEAIMQQMKFDQLHAAHGAMAGTVQEYRHRMMMQHVKIDEEKLASAMARHLAGLPITNWSVDEVGFTKRIRRGNATIEQLNKRNSLN